MKVSSQLHVLTRGNNPRSSSRSPFTILMRQFYKICTLFQIRSFHELSASSIEIYLKQEGKGTRMLSRRCNVTLATRKVISSDQTVNASEYACLWYFEVTGLLQQNAVKCDELAAPRRTHVVIVKYRVFG
jgi:hypothetical protein